MFSNKKIYKLAPHTQFDLVFGLHKIIAKMFGLESIIFSIFTYQNIYFTVLPKSFNKSSFVTLNIITTANLHFFLNK